MIFSTSGASAGIGFAVPVDTIQRLVPQLIRHGEPERVGLGIGVVPDHFARQNGIKGVIVESVAASAPAARAGLRAPRQLPTGKLAFDVIVGIDDTEVEGFDDLFGALDGKAPGDTVKVAIRRFPAGEIVKIDVQLIRL
jgi:S1-C subfamily serine protease